MLGGKRLWIPSRGLEWQRNHQKKGFLKKLYLVKFATAHFRKDKMLYLYQYPETSGRVLFSHVEISSSQYLKNLVHEQNLNHKNILRSKSRDWAAGIRASTGTSRSSHCGYQEDASRRDCWKQGQILVSKPTTSCNWAKKVATQFGCFLSKLILVLL